MARKSSLHLKEVPTDPIERAEHYFHISELELDKAWAKVEAVKLTDKGDGLPKGTTMEAYNKLLHDVDRRSRECFQMYDAWVATKKRIEREAIEAASPERTNVDKEDAKAIIRDSLNYSVEGMSFNMNVGLLAHGMLEAVFKNRVREEEQDAVLCDSCAGR